jgi:hypothetical protein
MFRVCHVSQVLVALKELRLASADWLVINSVPFILSRTIRNQDCICSLRCFMKILLVMTVVDIQVLLSIWQLVLYCFIRKISSNSKFLRL